MGNDLAGKQTLWGSFMRMCVCGYVRTLACVSTLEFEGCIACNSEFTHRA
jgi:hypothetical protein